MNGIVEAVSGVVPDPCRVHACNKDGCSISVRTAADRKAVVDLDCQALHIPQRQKRCDYLFFGEKGTRSWVVPIELKSGSFDAADVIDQLQGGADQADAWLPQEARSQLVPLLAHGAKAVRRHERAALRSRKVGLRGRTKQVVLARCGDNLKDVLDRSA